MLKRMNKDQKGSVTIEASLSLTFFLFVFIMIYSILTISRAQAKIQIALNSTAQEISQYSYIYGMSGLDSTLAKFQKDGDDTKSQINTMVSDTVSVFNDIQSLNPLGDRNSDSAGQEGVDIQNVLNKWGEISDKLNTTKDDFSAIKNDIQTIASNPKDLLFGMARLFGSEALELAKSRAIAEPITKALIKKHLKSSENGNEDDFCRSLGIVPGTYLGTKSSFNGLDFSQSTLFPYGSEEITLIASYKIKILQLIPIDIELNITQSAATKGWLHGDKTSNSALNIVTKDPDKPDSSVWNSQSINKRNEVIRKLELDELKKNGYKGVSGETYIQAYNESTNTFSFIAISNPVYGVDSVDKINRDSLVDDIKRQVAQIRSATDTRREITVKEPDDKGNITTRKIDCTKTAIDFNIVLVVPKDEGVKDYVESVINDLGYSNYYTVKDGYGTGYKLPEKEEE